MTRLQSIRGQIPHLLNKELLKLYKTLLAEMSDRQIFGKGINHRKEK